MTKHYKAIPEYRYDRSGRRTEVNTFKIISAKVEPGFQADYVTLTTDIEHPDYEGTLCITARTKRGTAAKWINDYFNIEEFDSVD